MIDRRAGFGLGLLMLGGLAPMSATAQSEAQACAGPLTEQLRRFSERCLAEVVGYVASQPSMGARISGESDKFYVLVVKDAKGFRAEAVSKFNYPLARDEAFDGLNRLGWTPPENENDNWKKPVAAENTAAAAQDVAKALEAYGLKTGEAMSLTVAPELSK